jgi:hypothetical protein
MIPGAAGGIFGIKDLFILNYLRISFHQIGVQGICIWRSYKKGIFHISLSSGLCDDWTPCPPEKKTEPQTGLKNGMGPPWANELMLSDIRSYFT